MSYCTLSRTGGIVETKTYKMDPVSGETFKSTNGGFKPILQLPGIQYGEFSSEMKGISGCRNYIMEKVLKIPPPGHKPPPRRFWDPKYANMTVYQQPNSRSFVSKGTEKCSMRRTQSEANINIFPLKWETGQFVGGDRSTRWCSMQREKSMNTFGASATYKAMCI